MAIGSKDLAPSELRGMDDDRLVDELRKVNASLAEAEEQQKGLADKVARLRR